MLTSETPPKISCTTAKRWGYGIFGGLLLAYSAQFVVGLMAFYENEAAYQLVANNKFIITLFNGVTMIAASPTLRMPPNHAAG